ncbi:MAG: hypothetical protein ACI9SB_000097 [Candidatus Azotimanducaceae bacterium]|jgi:hypothetical protein
MKVMKVDGSCCPCQGSQPSGVLEAKQVWTRESSLLAIRAGHHNLCATRHCGIVLDVLQFSARILFSKR